MVEEPAGTETEAIPYGDHLAYPPPIDRARESRQMEQDIAPTSPAPDIAPLFSADPQPHLHAVYGALREQAPVHLVPESRTWLISTYDDVRAIVRDPATWSSCYPERFGTGVVERAPATPRTEAAFAGAYPWVPTLLFQDGPEHRRHRVTLGSGLDGARVRRLEPAIREIVEGLVDAFPMDGDVELVRDLSAPLPVTVLAEALGVPVEDRARFRAWSDNVIELGAPMDEDDSVRVIEGYVAFQHYLVALIRARRAAPADDLLSALVATHDAAGADPEAALPELLGICMLLLAAGNDTTTALINALVVRLAEDPPLTATLRQDPARIPAAVEEALRLDSPVQMFQRRAVRDTELRGQPVRAGDMAMVMYGSANRDPARWDDADAFRLDRPNIRDHVAFTHGPHHCAGAMLARTQARIAVEVLLRRVGRFALDPARPPRFLPDLMTRGYAEVPLVVSAVSGS